MLSLFSSRLSELGRPHPPPAPCRRGCPPPPTLCFTVGPGGAHSLTGEGWGSPNSDEGTYSVVLCIYKYLCSIPSLKLQQEASTLSFFPLSLNSYTLASSFKKPSVSTLPFFPLSLNSYTLASSIKKPSVSTLLFFPFSLNLYTLSS